MNRDPRTKPRRHLPSVSAIAFQFPDQQDLGTECLETHCRGAPWQLQGRAPLCRLLFFEASPPEFDRSSNRRPFPHSSNRAESGLATAAVANAACSSSRERLSRSGGVLVIGVVV